ncbi:MAG: hypothetical protein ACOC44_19805 [Promethearchaeia archaeon]
MRNTKTRLEMYRSGCLRDDKRRTPLALTGGEPEINKKQTKTQVRR